MNDNIYPNQPFSNRIPQAQEKQDKQSLEEVLNQLPLLKKVVARLDEKIAFYGSVDSIPPELHTKPDEFMHAFAANRLVVENLKTERSYILTKVMKAQ